MSITEFITARLAEEEAEAQRWAPDVSEWPWADGRWSAKKAAARWQVNGSSGHVASGSEAATRFIAHHDPARVLARCKAMRCIVEQFDGWDGEVYDGWTQAASLVLGEFAYIWEEHPDFDKRWDPWL